jgi:ribosome-binding factor A
LTHKLERAGVTIQKELGPLISTRLNDPRLVGLVSVTSVEVAPDLATARVYVSILGSEDEQKKALQALEAASGMLSHSLEGRIRIRRMPKLRFLLDTRIEQGENMSELIDRVMEEDRRLRAQREAAGH